MNPYLEIIRPYTSFLSAFGVVAGAIVSGYPSSQMIGIAAIAAFMISGAGIILNDYYDFNIDKINVPNRPLPSGRINKKNALTFASLLFAAGIVMAATINIYCLMLAVLNSFLEFIYARKLKQIALLGNALDSWFVASTFIFGSLIIGNVNSVILLAILAFFSNMGREIFGDIEDLKGDGKMGLKTLPIIAGEKISRYLASMFILVSVILSLMPYYTGIFGIAYFIIVVLADFLFMISLFQNPSKNQKTTKIAMLLAMVAFIAGAVL